MPRRLVVISGMLLVFMAQVVQAQQPPVSLRTQLLFSALLPEQQDTIPEFTGMRSSRSPALAIVFSAVAPGTGQIYAERYWTIPLIWGFGYWFVRNYIQLDREYDEWSVLYDRSIALGAYAGSGDPWVKSIRDFYRDERDRFAFYLAITYVLNIVDAYVGASLYNFDVSEDLGGLENIRAEFRIPLK